MTPQRKSPRAVFHDYSGGTYFVTICTNEKQHYFGKIKDDVMCFSEIGQVAEKCLETLNEHYPYAEVPLFVVMPNHVHAIICINATNATKGTPATKDAPWCVPTKRTALSVVIGGYKQAVTQYARRNNIDFGWQQRYHDHIIRGFHDGNKIADYIENNVARWASDCFNE